MVVACFLICCRISYVFWHSSSPLPIHPPALLFAGTARVGAQAPASAPLPRLLATLWSLPLPKTFCNAASKCFAGTSRVGAQAPASAPLPRLLATLQTLPLPITTLAMLPRPVPLHPQHVGAAGRTAGGAGGTIGGTATSAVPSVLLGAGVTAGGTIEVFAIRRGAVRGLGSVGH